jgi:glycosyltransferase involved in cell wall biosynthesis
MQVLHIITGLSDGGAEAVLYRLCQFEKEHNHIVISLQNEDKYGPMLKELGVDVYTLNFLNGNIRFLGLVKLYKLIKKIQPDVIQTWMYHADFIGGVMGRLAGIRNIVWGVHHTTLVKGKSKRSTILIAKINSFISNFIPKKIIYCASKSREVQESIGFNKIKGEVIPNGYDIRSFTQNSFLGTAFRNELNILNKTFVIGHVGRYNPQKDHNTLLESFSILRQKKFDFSAVIVGTNLDENNHKLVSLLNENNITDCVYLLGKRADIPAVMNGIDLFVLSSAFGEAFPNVLNESMACGTPCVATDVGDSSAIIGMTGWITPIQDPLAIANSIIKAAEEKLVDSSLWLQRKDDCRKRIVENFSIEKMISKYKKVWSEQY